MQNPATNLSHFFRFACSFFFRRRPVMSGKATIKNEDPLKLFTLQEKLGEGYVFFITAWAARPSVFFSVSLTGFGFLSSLLLGPMAVCIREFESLMVLLWPSNKYPLMKTSKTCVKRLRSWRCVTVTSSSRTRELSSKEQSKFGYVHLLHQLLFLGDETIFLD